MSDGSLTNRPTSNGPVTAVVIMGGRKYDSASFVVPTGSTNVSLKDLTPINGHAFENIPRAYFAEIAYDQDITLRLNDVSNDPIAMAAEESPWKDMHIELTDIFVTNSSGLDCKIKLLLF